MISHFRFTKLQNLMTYRGPHLQSAALWPTLCRRRTCRPLLALLGNDAEPVGRVRGSPVGGRAGRPTQRRRKWRRAPTAPRAHCSTRRYKWAEMRGPHWLDDLDRPSFVFFLFALCLEVFSTDCIDTYDEEEVNTKRLDGKRCQHRRYTFTRIVTTLQFYPNLNFTTTFISTGVGES